MSVRYVVESYKEVLKDNLKYLDLPPDVLIIAKNKVFEAHSELLKIGSDFFRQIFTSNLTIDGVEYYSYNLWSSFKLIRLKNFKVEDLTSLLLYVYSGEIHIEPSKYEEIMQTAEDLEILGLCSKTLHNLESYPEKTFNENVQIEIDPYLYENNEAKSTNYEERNESFMDPPELISLENGRVKCTRCDVELINRKSNVKQHLKTKTCKRKFAKKIAKSAFEKAKQRLKAKKIAQAQMNDSNATAINEILVPTKLHFKKQWLEKAKESNSVISEDHCYAKTFELDERQVNDKKFSDFVEAEEQIDKINT